ncbi:MAG TPA: HAD hydrolase-like protein [Candidatus Blautia stercoravium]|nr:HAD hydrolase-like protein [Candidatus Blautia stercoravium]
MRYKALLFDLDGTLTASGEGITKSVQYALRKMGKGALGEHLEDLEVFVGPPLLNQFMAYAGFSEEEAGEAVKHYRERYTVTGIFENRPYEGIAELLEKLQAKGYLLAVASSKPDSMVKIVLDHFHLEGYFQVIKGSDIVRPKMTKAQVIEEVLAELRLENRREEAVMIGDRFYDVRGAKETGLSCIGVTYGYGNREELQREGALKIAETVDELGQILEV